MVQASPHKGRPGGGTGELEQDLEGGGVKEDQAVHGTDGLRKNDPARGSAGGKLPGAEVVGASSGESAQEPPGEYVCAEHQAYANQQSRWIASRQVLGLPARLSWWTVNQVRTWLEHIDFGRYGEIFGKHNISGAVLLALNSDILLADMGIKCFGDRFLILTARDTLAQSTGEHCEHCTHERAPERDVEGRPLQGTTCSL